MPPGATGRPAPASVERLLVVGFAAESEDLLENARGKLARKRLDLIVANDVTQEGSGFGTETNQVTLLDRWGGEEVLPLLSKADVAHHISDRTGRGGTRRGRHLIESAGRGDRGARAAPGDRGRPRP